MDSCIFCKIIMGDIPSAKIYEDEEFIAFLDIFPVNKGHTLVVSKKHYETTYDMPKGLLGKMMEVVHNLASKIYEKLNADGYNIQINNKPAAGQEVPHAHYHIIPRFEEDGLKFNWPKQKYLEGELEKYREKLQ